MFEMKIVEERIVTWKDGKAHDCKAKDGKSHE